MLSRLQVFECGPGVFKVEYPIDYRLKTDILLLDEAVEIFKLGLGTDSNTPFYSESSVYHKTSQ